MATIKDAIESVLTQTYQNIEYIIIDGESTDGTIDVIKSYGNQVSKFISETDEGIYDGLNKGIELASGDVICFLHSDDLYVDSSVIQKIANVFVNNNIDGTYGDLVYVSKIDTAKVLRYWKSKDFELKFLKQGWMPAHPTFFLRKEVYKKFGTFDLGFKIAADYDFMLRVLGGGIKVKYLPEVLYKMRIGGESNKSVKNIIRKSKEDLRALKKNNIGHIYTLLYKNISKITQFIIKNKNT